MGGDWLAHPQLDVVRRHVVGRDSAKSSAVIEVEVAELGLAEARCIRQNGVEYRRKFALRTRAMVRSASEVALCCSSASSRSRLSSATCSLTPAAGDRRWRVDFGAVRSFGVAAFRRRDLTDAEPALERRRIGHPKAQDYADFQRGITAGICHPWNGVQGSICAAKILSR